MRYPVIILMLLVSQVVGGIWKRESRRDRAARGLSYEEINALEFDMSVLRPQDVPDTAVVNEALKAMGDLNRKPFCHKLTATMLLDNCRSTSDSQSIAATVREAERREAYLKIFAVALTMCDIDALQRPVPAQCASYSQAALESIYERGDSTSIHLNSQEMSGCLKAIGMDQSAVVSWKINQQSAALVCQVSRMDIEKDEAIALFAKATRLMSEVVNETTKLSKVMEHNARQAEKAAESVNEVKSNVEKLKHGLTNIWTGISTEAVKAQRNARDAFSSMTTYASDFEGLMSKLRKNALDNHAEQAVAFQRNVDASNDLALKTRETQKEMDELKGMMHSVYSTLNVMSQGLVAIQERQEKVDRQSAKVLSAMVNMTSLLYEASEAGTDHTITLSKAQQAANSLLDILAKSESHASTWQAQMLAGKGPFGIGWLLFIGTPMATVALGSYKRQLSILQTISLAILGVPLAVLISMSCDWKWQSVMAEYFAHHPLAPIATAASAFASATAAATGGPEMYRSTPL